MSCCGKNRDAFRQAGTIPTRSAAPSAPPALPPRTWRSTVDFEYMGEAGISVLGPISGRRYDFLRPGAVVAVDVRDRRHLAAVPGLRQRA